MSIKRILVPLPGLASHTGQIETALSAAKALGAHVQALFISQPPPDTRSGVTRGSLKCHRNGTSGERCNGKLVRRGTGAKYAGCA